MRRDHILGAAGAMRCISPNRLHAQVYQPSPARRRTWWRCALRALLRSLT